MKRIACAFVCLALSFSGCVQLAKEAPVIHAYAIQVDRDVTDQDLPATQVRVKLRRVKVREPYDGCAIMHAVSAHELRADYYNRFTLSPAVMLTTLCAEWLRSVPQVGHVSDERDMIECSHEIRVTVHTLYVDHAEGTVPHAVLAVSFCVYDAQKFPYEVLFEKRYEERAAIDETGVPAVIEGWNCCLRSILMRFEDDFVQSLSGEQKVSE